MKRVRAGFLSLLALTACDENFRFDPGTPAAASCKSDEDCRLSGAHCDGATGSCGACTDAAQCASSALMRCDPASRACVACTEDADCGKAQTCETISHTCRTMCIEDDVCPIEAPACDELRGICIRCTHDIDCARDEPFCERVSGRCLTCLRDEDCPVGKPRCDRPLGTCVGCTAANDCAPPTACDPATNSCR